MIGVVIPAHNEEACIAGCLASVIESTRCAGLHGEAVEVFVVLDRCDDATEAIASAHGVTMVRVSAGNVGTARGTGAEMAIARGARWVACTDADSQVPGDWLSAQLHGEPDAFCGMVEVRDWMDFDDSVRHAFVREHGRHDGHRHVHGANLGVSAAMYTRCGGFPPLAAHEDVALVDALVCAGARIARRARPTVITSARRLARAPVGFAGYLARLEAMACHQTDSTGILHCAL